MLSVWLPLNGDLRNQGLKNVTVTDGEATIDDNGKIGKCYRFGTAKSFLELPAEAMNDFTTECTVSFWLKILTRNTGWDTYFQAGLGGTPWNNYVFGFLRNNSNKCCFTVSGEAGTSSGSFVTSDMELDTWYHITLVYQTGHCLIYMDGILYHDYPTAIVPAFNNITTITIGCANTKANYQSNCLLNDLRIYDTALSPREVKEISKGLVLHYPLNRGGFGSPNLIINSKNIKNSHLESGNEYMALNVGQSYMDIESGTQVTISFDLEMKYVNTGTSSAKYLHIYNTNNKGPKQISDVNWYPEQHGYSVGDIIKTRASVTTTIVDRADHKTDDNYIEFYTVYNTGNVFSISNLKVEVGNKATPWTPNPADDLYSQMGLDNNIVYDCSGYCNNGETMTDTITYSSDTPRYNISTHFNGTYDGIIIENLQLSNIINTEITYSFWVKPENEKGGRSVYFGSYSGSSWSIEKTSSNVLRLYWNGSPDETFNCIITDDVWQHICITKSGTNDVKIYKNGVQVATSTKTHSELNFPTTYRIGRDVRSNDGTPYKGLMSDFRIYATALSAEDVYNLYAVGASISDTGVLFSNEVSEV